MGAFLTNYHIRGKSAAEVSKAVTGLVQSRAYVSPEKSGWVTVYDFDSDRQEETIITNLAAGLSKALNTSVLAFLVHDSDIAVYWLYQNGALADEFNSAPDYFKEVSETEKLRVRGDADELLPLCVAGTTLEQVEEVIHPADGFPTFAESILEDFAKLLGIDEARLSGGFRYFEEEGEEMLPDASEFTPIGKKAAPKKKRSPKSSSQKLPFDFDMFPIAIGMMTKVWTGEHEKMAEAFSGRFPNQDSSKMVSQLREGFDRSARDFLKKSKLPNLPNFEELRTARDQGPEALAKLVVQRVPTQLGSIADGAIGEGLKRFIAALLANGMDPKTPNQHGKSLLEVAEQCKQPEIYNLLKTAIDKKG
jgi:hypothetical protein